MTDTPTPRTDAIHNTYLTNIFTIDYLTDKLTIESRSLERELTAAREERDRLAEALNRIAYNTIPDHPETDYAYALGRMEGIAKIVLQSLTTNETSSTANIYPCQECGKAGLATPNTICPICGGE